jgi:trehalose synthase
MAARLEDYARVAGEDVVEQLRQLARRLEGRRVVHINSTRVGGGVAEILDRLVPLTRELGIDATWEVIEGDDEFYRCTKAFHNALQGQHVEIPDPLLRRYEATNARNAEALRERLDGADVVIVHDPQPAGLRQHLADRVGHWIWRCHIDVSRPFRPVWGYLRRLVAGYEASIWSLADFTQRLPHPQYLVPPSIDPLSEKNVPLPDEEVAAARARFGLDPARPLVVQISRFDRFKDPLGVVRAYRLAKAYVPGLQLLLAGGGADDDPEGAAVLAEVHAAAAGDPDCHVLLLPPDAHRTINALQRAADVVVQKSLREGFGLTVTEALWKGKPVVGGNTGGIRLQVIDHHTGFRVDTPEGAALRIRYLLDHPERREAMGRTAQEYVREQFLLTRHLREYLTIIVACIHGHAERIEL